MLLSCRKGLFVNKSAGFTNFLAGCFSVISDNDIISGPFQLLMVRLESGFLVTFSANWEKGRKIHSSKAFTSNL